MKHKKNSQNAACAASAKSEQARVRIILDSYSEDASRNLQTHKIKALVKKDMDLLGHFNFFGQRIKSAG